MPRSIWSGAISFGLVNVPIKLYSAVSKKTVRFHQLHGDTGTRIQQRRVDPSTGEEVAYDDIVKGYEIGKDRYVVITPDELDSLDPEKTRTIEMPWLRPDALRSRAWSSATRSSSSPSVQPATC
jgi:DNA end-binding protein Ku